MVALDYAGESSCGAQAVLVEWTRRMAREELSAAQPLSLEGFYQAVKGLIRNQ